jgi:hypothetical protein
MRYKIGILIVCVGKYDVFLPPLLESVNKHFFKDDDVTVFLFSDNGIDKHKYLMPERLRVVNCMTNPERTAWPYPTLDRYQYFYRFGDLMKDMDYLLYVDCDSLLVDDVGREMLPDKANTDKLIAVRHPGFFRGGGSWETNEKSLAYIAPEKRIKYFCGGVQGGSTKEYLSACYIMYQAIEHDEKTGNRACWNDESHWNRYLTACYNFKELDPSCCMVEETEKRIAWGINDLPVKIIALAKDHSKFQIK